MLTEPPSKRKTIVEGSEIVTDGLEIGQAILAHACAFWSRSHQIGRPRSGSPNGSRRINHPRRDLVRRIGICPASPSQSLELGRGWLFHRNVWPDFRVFGIQPQPFLSPGSVSGLIASTGHSGTQTPQSMHSSGWMTSMFSPS